MYSPFPHATDARQNQLLAALPETDWHRWQTHLEPVELPRGEVLFEAGCAPVHVIFPTTAVVSLLCLTQDGDSAEVAVVGHDGLVGLSLFMGGNATPSHAVVQSAGRGYRLSALRLRHEVEAGGAVLRMLLRYTQTLMGQVAQTAACNRHHTVAQQVCRRLLAGLDRSGSSELVLTHEAISQLLGVRREGVTAAAQQLAQAGVISYRRGRIAVLDRRRLEQHTCECYAVNRKEYERLLPAARRA